MATALRYLSTWSCSRLALPVFIAADLSMAAYSWLPGCGC